MEKNFGSKIQGLQYGPLKFDFGLLITDVHSILSKILALHFIPQFLKSHSTPSIHINICLNSPPPSPPSLPSSSFFAALSQSILTPCPSHSNVFTLNTVTISGDLNYENFLIHFYSPGVTFISWPTYSSHGQEIKKTGTEKVEEFS